MTNNSNKDNLKLKIGGVTYVTKEKAKNGMVSTNPPPRPTKSDI